MIDPLRFAVLASKSVSHQDLDGQPFVQRARGVFDGVAHVSVEVLAHADFLQAFANAVEGASSAVGSAPPLFLAH